MLLAAAKTLVSKLTGDTGKKSREDGQGIKNMFGTASSIAIGREDESGSFLRWEAQNSDGIASGSMGPEGDPDLRWRDFIWTGPATIDECAWGEVRWRFYSNGLVCFDARMSNTSSRLDQGDMQGHRIELREKNGLLIGVWIAGFFVRRSLPERGYAASFMDTHEPLKLHFSDLEDVQSGAWVYL